MGSIKKFFINLYYQKGPAVGKYLLINMGITAIGFLIICCTGSGILLKGFLEVLVAIPTVSIAVTIARVIVSLLHVIVPMQRGAAKAVFDFFCIVLLISCIGFFMKDVPMPESYFLQILITIVIDVIYISTIITLLAAKKITPVEPTENIE